MESFTQIFVDFRFFKMHVKDHLGRGITFHKDDNFTVHFRNNEDQPKIRSFGKVHLLNWGCCCVAYRVLKGT